MTVSAQISASKTHGEGTARKAVQSSEAKEKHQGYMPELSTKGAVMVGGLRPKSVPIKTDHNTKLVATKHQKCPEDKGNKTRIPRIEIKRKRAKKQASPLPDVLFGQGHI